MRKCMQLDEKLREMDKEISVNPQYIQKVCYYKLYFIPSFQKKCIRKSKLWESTCVMKRINVCTTVKAFH